MELPQQSQVMLVQAHVIRLSHVLMDTAAKQVLINLNAS